MYAGEGMAVEEHSDDPRGQLVERISATEPFRKSPRFRDLLKALGFSSSPSIPIYFEVLIKTQAIAGAPVKSSVVATRLIQPKN
ncbi:MAG: hypothetical protein ABSC77_01290 [Terracidiphilus sp.]|jgi:hypothetical protein